MSTSTKNSAEQAGRFENYFYESLASSRHSVGLDSNEEVMKPERFKEAPDHSGFNPDTMRVGKCFQKTTLKGDVSHFLSFSCTSDTFVETYLTWEREPIEDDDERLSMKIGDMPPPLPGRVSNPRIRDDHELNEFCSNPDKMHCATSDDVHTKSMVWVQSIIYIPTICGKIGKDIELLNGSIYQCSILFSNLRSFNRKSEFWKPGNLPFTKSEQINIAELSLLNEILEKQLCPCYLDVRGGQFPDRHKAVDSLDYGLVGCHSARSPWPVSPCKKLTPQVMFAFFGNQSEKQLSFPMRRFLR